MNLRVFHLLAPVAAACVILAGCGKSAEKATPPPPTAAASSPLDGFFGAVDATGDVIPIPQLRKDAQPGHGVVVEAKVMGAVEPFVENRALFVVGDEGTLSSCDQIHGDACRTPWDNCCDDPDALRVGTATIQVVDEKGNVLRHGIKGVAGLRELSRVRVAGEVAPGSTEAALVINASRIEVL